MLFPGVKTMRIHRFFLSTKFVVLHNCVSFVLFFQLQNYGLFFLQNMQKILYILRFLMRCDFYMAALHVPRLQDLVLSFCLCVCVCLYIIHYEAWKVLWECIQNLFCVVCSFGLMYMVSRFENILQWHA